MLFVSKLVQIIALPLGIVFILLLLCIKNKKRSTAVSAALFLYLCSIDIIADQLIANLESKFPLVPMDSESLQGADAIIVLSGIIGPISHAGYLPNFQESVERLEGGVELHKRGVAPVLVFTGGHVPWDPQGLTEGDTLKQLAIMKGVSPASILVASRAGNTAEEAIAVNNLAHDRKWKRIILVTTGWHMPRAVLLFSSKSIELLPFPVDIRHDPMSRRTLLNFLPTAKALANTEIALREIYAGIYYRLRQLTRSDN